MKFAETLYNLPNISIFRVSEGSDLEDDFSTWLLEPINAPILAPENFADHIDGYFILKALFIPETGELQSCYLDVMMPERISEQVFFKINKDIESHYIHCTNGEIIPSVAISGFGLYELYYSRKNPEIGIEILRNGLKVSKIKKYIAMDLGYIFRDENRYEEAIQAFSISIEEGAENEYVYLERANLFEQIGDIANAEKDRDLANDLVRNGKPYF